MHSFPWPLLLLLAGGAMPPRGEAPQPVPPALREPLNTTGFVLRLPVAPLEALRVRDDVDVDVTLAARRSS